MHAHPASPASRSSPLPPCVVVCRLSHRDGRVQIVNVEYNQLDPLLRAEVNPEGDVPDASGFSPYPGQPLLHLHVRRCLGAGRFSRWPAPWHICAWARSAVRRSCLRHWLMADGASRRVSCCGRQHQPADLPPRPVREQPGEVSRRHGRVRQPQVRRRRQDRLQEAHAPRVHDAGLPQGQLPARLPDIFKTVPCARPNRSRSQLLHAASALRTPYRLGVPVPFPVSNFP